MAKARVVGNAVVITSEARYSDIEKIAKYKPDALVLKGGEDGKEEIFRVKTGGDGRVNTYGIEFTSASRDENGFASVTIVLDDGIADVRAFVAEEFGTAIMNLLKLEATWPETLESIDANRTEILNAIEVL